MSTDDGFRVPWSGPRSMTMRCKFGGNDRRRVAASGSTGFSNKNVSISSGDDLGPKEFTLVGAIPKEAGKDCAWPPSPLPDSSIAAASAFIAALPVVAVVAWGNGISLAGVTSKELCNEARLAWRWGLVETRFLSRDLDLSRFLDRDLELSFFLLRLLSDRDRDFRFALDRDRFRSRDLPFFFLCLERERDVEEEDLRRSLDRDRDRFLLSLSLFLSLLRLRSVLLLS